MEVKYEWSKKKSEELHRKKYRCLSSDLCFERRVYSEHILHRVDVSYSGDSTVLSVSLL